MKSKLCKCFMMVMACFVAVTLVPKANAEYPDKPIEFATHGGAGGGSDMYARTVAQILEKEGIVKQKIRVANRTGGSGTVCMDYIASRKGDPYVLGIISMAPLSTVIRKVSVMKYEDLILLALTTLDPNLIFARYDAPYNNMKELVAEAKKSGRELNLALGSIGGMEHVSVHRTIKTTGMRLNLVSFKSGAGGAVALLGGHADLSVNNYGEMMGQVEGKKLKALGVMTEKRHPLLPNVPTFREQGFDVVGINPRGFWAPQDFPPAAIKYWEDAFAKLVKTKAYKDYNDSTFGIQTLLTGKELRAYFDNTVAAIDQDLKELGLYTEKK